jgi:hypothetical protein
MPARKPLANPIAALSGLKDFSNIPAIIEPLSVFNLSGWHPFSFRF